MAKIIIKTFTDTILTAPALAEIFGVTDRTIRNWREDGMPEAAPGKYSVVECFAWWQENINKPGSDKEAKSRERYWSAKAEREELAVKKLQESVLDRSDLQAVWCQRLSEVIRGLESQEHVFPALLANLPPSEIRRLVEDYNRKLREGYARAGKYTPVVEVAGKKIAQPKQQKPLKAKASEKKKSAPRRKASKK